MKKLILVRHAKSSWKDTKMDDRDRTLNKRGERDAPHMATVVKKRKINADLMAASTAVRAIATAKEFAKKLDYPKDKILREDALYLAETDDLLKYVKNISEDKETVFLFGHNPGITALANYLTGGDIDNIPTCGICAI